MAWASFLDGCLMGAVICLAIDIILYKLVEVVLLIFALYLLGVRV